MLGVIHFPIPLWLETVILIALVSLGVLIARLVISILALRTEKFHTAGRKQIIYRIILILALIIAILSIPIVDQIFFLR